MMPTGNRGLLLAAGVHPGDVDDYNLDALDDMRGDYAAAIAAGQTQDEDDEDESEEG